MFFGDFDGFLTENGGTGRGPWKGKFDRGFLHHGTIRQWPRGDIWWGGCNPIRSELRRWGWADDVLLAPLVVLVRECEGTMTAIGEEMVVIRWIKNECVDC